MTESTPNLFSIPSGAPFLDQLAKGVIDRYWRADDPLSLTGVTILLPTRRAVREIGQAFLRAAESPALALPDVQALGDIDDEYLTIELGRSGFDNLDVDLPEAVSPIRRQLLLARLVREWMRANGQGTFAQAVHLAGDLAHFLDAAATEQVDLDGLENLAPAEFADHWRDVLSFLEIVTRNWPEILAADGKLDPAKRRNLALNVAADAWRRLPPDRPLIAAGSTGSIKATRALLGVIAAMPLGAVVLPGLDLLADEDSWDLVGPSHPQFGMKNLLGDMGAERSAVADWAPKDRGDGFDNARELRTRIINEAMRPWERTDRWRALGAQAATMDAGKGPSIADAFSGVERIDAAHSNEEAAIIALILREAVEDQTKSAALVTPDRTIARRVATELRRWGIEVDDSAGRPLISTPPLALARLLSEAASQGLAPYALLSFLKHPLALGGAVPGVFRAQARALETAILRGPRPAPGFEGLRAALALVNDEAQKEMLAQFTDDLEKCIGAFVACFEAPTAPFEQIVKAHVAACERISLGPKSDQSQIWASDAGEAAASFFVDVLGQANLIGEISPLQYGDIIEALAFSRSVRQVGNIHPNVAIWGPLEARLQSADVVVLGGLNEGVWPTEPAIDPWLSRPMRAALGMSAPEARIGLAAHDFVQNASAERVFLTRSEKVDGAPTVPSRWLLRLETVLQAFGAAHTLRSNGSYQAWSDNFEEPDTADKQAAPIMAPKPTPPVAARPRQLSVTQIETWIRDPYAIYARKILGLEQIDPIDANPGAAERGILIHQALFQFIEKFPKTMPKDATAQLLEIGRELFDQASSGPEVDAIWWPRFEAAAAWFVEYERAARATGRQPVGGEISGSVVIAAPGGPFRLTARADRIDKDAANAIEIWDYKTGGAPTDRQVQSGLTPQLSLEAAIAQAGGFDGVAAGALARLGYIKLSGGLEPGVVQAIKADPSALAGAALAGLERLIIQYDDPTTPYVSRARPMFEARTGGYDHLARAKEWASFGSEDSQ